MLYTTLEAVRIAALLSQPVMPESTGKLLDLLGQPDDQRTFAAIGTRLAPGTALPAPVGVSSRAIRRADVVVPHFGLARGHLRLFAEIRT